MGGESVSSSSPEGKPDCRAEATAGIDSAAERAKQAQRRRRCPSPSKQQQAQQQAARRADFDSRAPQVEADIQDEDFSADEDLGGRGIAGGFLDKRYDAAEKVTAADRLDCAPKRRHSWSPRPRRRRSRRASSSTQATAGSKRVTLHPAADAMPLVPAAVIASPEDYFALAKQIVEAREAHDAEVLH